jgi:beta-glucosidase
VTVTATVTSSKLAIAAATASSVENAGTPASAAIDNNAGTRWASAFSDPQWIALDLGAAKNVTGVVLVWETASGKTYKVQASNDAAFGTSVDLSSVSATNCAGRTDSLAVNSGGAYRYVRMLGATRCTGWGYSIWEARVYGY